MNCIDCFRALVMTGLFFLPTLASGQTDTVSFATLTIHFTKVDTQAIGWNEPSLLHAYNWPEGSLPIGNLGGREISLNGPGLYNIGFRSMLFSEVKTADTGFYMIARKPYSEIRYFLGMGAEQNLRLIHTQRVRPNFYLSAVYQKINTAGFYQRQGLDKDHLIAAGHFIPPTGRYRAHGNLQYIRSKRQLNGGISSDSAFEDIGFGNKELLTVNLSEATAQYAVVDGRFDHSFQFWERDTLGHGLGLFHEFRYQHQVRTHYDKGAGTDGFYTVLNLGQNESFERVQLDTWTNQGGIEWRCHYAKARVGWIHQWQSYEAPGRGLNAQQQGLRIDAKGGVDRLMIRANWGMNIFGYSAGNRFIDGYVDWDDSSYAVSASVHCRNVSPAIELQSVSFNNFSWGNQFVEEGHLRLTLGGEWKPSHTRLNVRFDQYENLIYFDTSWTPQQEGQYVQMVSGTIRQGWKGKSIFGHVELTGQYTGDETVVPVPGFIGKFRLGWKVNLFKKNLMTLMGIEGFYVSAWNAPGYIPAIDQFYVQPEQVGGFPYLTAFINARITEVEVFLKVSNFNAGLLGNNYYAAYLYPMNDLSVVGGIRWQFTN